MNQRFEYKTNEVFAQDLPGKAFHGPEKEGWRIIKMWRQREGHMFIIVYERPFETPQ